MLPVRASNVSAFYKMIACDNAKGASITSVSVAQLREEQRSLWPETDKSLCLMVDVSLEHNGFDVEEIDGISTWTDRGNKCRRSKSR